MNLILARDNLPATNGATDMGTTPGRVLFQDKRLSTHQTVACASCHRQANGFSDPRKLSVGFNGGQTGRNSIVLPPNPGVFGKDFPARDSTAGTRWTQRKGRGGSDRKMDDKKMKTQTRNLPRDLSFHLSVIILLPRPIFWSSIFLSYLRCLLRQTSAGIASLRFTPVAFLKTLTDPNLATDEKFSDPFNYGN